MKTNDLILLVEDDPQQSETIVEAIRRRFQNADVVLVETESEFYNRIDEIPVSGPHPRMVICDVMLPWTFAAPDAPSPPEKVTEGTFRKAGLRCWERFRRRQDLRSIPFIYFTVLDENTIDLANHRDDRTGFARKSGPMEDLFDEIEEWPETNEEVTESLKRSPKMRRILLDGLNTSIGDCATSLS